MKIENSFYEDEVRNGFFIPSMIKRAWAAEMEILSEIDRICKKYNITYYAEWGTLLGTVRHKGFIPWDDDMDISMKRADYERFMEVAQKELSEGYLAYNYRNNPDEWTFIGRVVNKNRICFEQEHLERFHGFPYIAAIDIFSLDYINADRKKEKERCMIAEYIILTADAIDEGRITGKDVEKSLKKIEELSKVSIDRGMNGVELRTALYIIADSMFALFKEKEADRIAHMPDGLGHVESFIIPKDYFDGVEMLPYENFTMPVPAKYDALLKKRYGDYMVMVRNICSHDYPFFEAQKSQLEAVMGFEVPHFTFAKEMLGKDTSGKEKALKYIISHDIKVLTDKAADLKVASDQNTVMRILSEEQQIAVAMGELIESCKGEGTETVKNLEQLCESIYQYYMAVDTGTEQQSDRCSELDKILDQVKTSSDKEVMQRREVVFITYKPDYWNVYEEAYQKAVRDENCDVYVIPVPYYYKKYDGTMYDRQYDTAGYPDGVTLTKYDEYDIMLHHPEVVYIQNPYDEWNSATSVDSYFYSSNLKKYTDALVYVPYFTVDEFSRENYREYYNMQYYCTMPGVINADQVYVQSENMKQVYVEKLTEFCGEDTRDVWERKIQ